MNYLKQFPSYTLEKIEAVKKLLSPHTKRAYLVGGCVRDVLLKKEIHDLDIEIYDINPAHFDKIMKSAGAKGVGKSFFVYKYEEIDFALPRVERKVGEGHKAFEVKLCNDEKKASSRRDFTMNAMMINIFTGELLDFWEGKDALNKKVIKHIEEEAFKEDSLRVLRAVQFAARFDLDIDKDTLHVMKSIDIADLSLTRVFWELQKLFKAKHLHVGVKYLYELNLFEKIFGLYVNTKECEKINKELQGAKFLEHLREYYLLYIITCVTKTPCEKLLQKLQAPTKYLKTFKYQPCFEKIPSDFELFCITMNIPIKNWLGNYKEEITKRAKKLGIFEEVYTGGIDIQDVIKDGFKKEAIKKEYERRVLASISQNFLKNN